MESREICKEEKKDFLNDSSFTENIEEINDIFQNISSQSFNFKFEQEKKEKEKLSSIFENNYFEEADLDEIYDVLHEINQAITIDLNTANKKDYYNNKTHAHSEQNTNIINDDHSNECQEILSILKKPLSNKDVRNIKFFDTPFKPLLKPKKVSMVGKVLCDKTSYNTVNANTQSSSQEKNNNNNNSNNNNLLINGN
jgi:hypothetical protein